MRYITVCCCSIVLLLLTADCSTHRGANDSFKALEAARATYSTLQSMAQDMRDRDLITVKTWNQRIVPLDNQINSTLYRAYGFLRLYVAARQQPDYDQFVNLLREATQLLDEFNLVLEESKHEGDRPS